MVTDYFNQDNNRIGFARLALYLLCGTILFFYVLIVPVVFGMSVNPGTMLDFPPKGFSLRWYHEFFASYHWMTSLRKSISVALVTILLSTPLGTLAAIGVNKATFRGKELLNILFITPMIVPLIIIAFSLYVFYSEIGILATFWGLVIAHTVITIPFVFINVSAQLQGLNPDLERASLIMGAKPLDTFRRVTLPLIKPGIIAGAIFAFMTSFSEVVIAIFISGPGEITFPVRMWEGIRTEVTPRVAAAASVVTVFSLALFALAGLFQKKTA